MFPEKEVLFEEKKKWEKGNQEEKIRTKGNECNKSQRGKNTLEACGWPVLRAPFRH